MHPGPRRRGRPLKAFDGDIPAEKRRGRARQAQNAFRSRKKTNSNLTVHRVKQLADIIEQMSIEHNNVAEALLKSRAIQKDPSVVPRLQQSMERFIHLAFLAIKHESAQEDSGSEHQASLSGTIDAPVSMYEHPSSTTESAVAQDETVSNHNAASLERAGDVTMVLLQNISEAESSLLHHPVYFGTYWSSYGPWAFPPRVVPPSIISHIMAWQLYPFGMFALHSLLNVGNQSLTNGAANKSSIAQSIFRFAFVDFTIQELGLILKFYLGPARDEMPCLGFSTYTFDHDGYQVPGKPTLQSLRNAPRHTKGGHYLPYPSFQDIYLSFFELNSILGREGIYDISTSTFSMLISSVDSLPNTVDTSASETAKVHLERQKCQDMFNFDCFFRHGSSPMEPTSLARTRTEEISKSTGITQHKILVISVPRSFEELTTITVCLQHGPAIMRPLIMPAVLASVLSSSDST